MFYPVFRFLSLRSSIYLSSLFQLCLSPRVSLSQSFHLYLELLFLLFFHFSFILSLLSFLFIFLLLFICLFPPFHLLISSLTVYIPPSSFHLCVSLCLLLVYFLRSLFRFLFCLIFFIGSSCFPYKLILLSVGRILPYYHYLWLCFLQSFSIFILLSSSLVLCFLCYLFYFLYKIHPLLLLFLLHIFLFFLLLLLLL